MITPIHTPTHNFRKGDTLIYPMGRMILPYKGIYWDLSEDNFFTNSDGQFEKARNLLLIINGNWTLFSSHRDDMHIAIPNRMVLIEKSIFNRIFERKRKVGI